MSDSQKNERVFVPISVNEFINLMFDNHMEELDFVLEIDDHKTWFGVRLLDPFDHWSDFPDVMIIGTYGWGAEKVFLLSGDDGDEIDEEQDARRAAIWYLERYVYRYAEFKVPVLVDQDIISTIGKAEA